MAVKKKDGQVTQQGNENDQPVAPHPNAEDAEAQRENPEQAEGPQGASAPGNTDKAGIYPKADDDADNR